MTGAGQYLTLAMTMIFAENLLFSRGMGGDVTLRVSVRPAEYMKFGALITVFTVLSSLVGWIADSLIARMSIVVSTSVFPGRTLAYLLCMIGLSTPPCSARRCCSRGCGPPCSPGSTAASSAR